MRMMIFACSAFLFLAACSPYSRTDRTIAGGLIGAGTGALIGGIASRHGTGALVGGIVGGIAGATIGAATTPRACIARDEYGRRIRVPCA